MSAIAFLGLGRMGRILAGHALEAGHEVAVWNRSAASADDLVALGARWAATPAEAVSTVDVVVTVLFGPDAVRDVVLLDDGAFRRGALWIDVTTVGPADADGFAAWAAERGIRHVQAPVLGSLGPARDRALGVLLGGASDAVDEAAALTALWADPSRVHRYPTAGQAATAKLVVNLGLAVAMQGLVEAVRLGEAGGLGLDQVLAVLDRTPLAPIAAGRGRAIDDVGFEAQFTVDALRKDVDLMQAAAGLTLPALDAVAGRLRAAQRAGLGGADFSAIGRVGGE